jgi:3-hydroxyisobutyrate dehydrogenase-like beta-hydroxyacid dehydrogenase
VKLIIGLGPIGASVGEHLAERPWHLAGLDLDADRAAVWQAATGVPAFSRFDDIAWDQVDTVLIAVRVADQVRGCFDELARSTGGRPLTVFVVTTLAPGDAIDIFTSAPAEWRVFEAPVSGGPQGARDGSMTIFLSGPEPTEPESRLLGDMARRVFRSDAYGQPATVKLLNNTLGAFNALSTAAMLDLAMERGIKRAQFLEAVGASSGQSWMSDHFDDFAYDLLFKDVRLLLSDLGALPTISLDASYDADTTIAAARTQAPAPATSTTPAAVPAHSPAGVVA